jgi:hypothetical protein
MFDQIKAKLGLDITSFQRGLAASQKDLSKFQENARGKLMSFFAPATILAGIASVISKAQELRDKAIEAGEAFSDSVRQTAEMGDNIDRAKNFLFELAAKGLAAYQSRIENVTAGIIALFDPKLTKEQILKNLQEQKKLEAQGKIADREAEKREKERIEKEKKDIQEIGKNFKAAADEREKRKFEELSLDDKIAKRREDAAMAEKDYNDKNKTSEERSAALLKREQMLTELKNLENQRTEETKKQLDLEDQKLKKLQEQKKAITEGMREARRNAVLPTLEDVTSGKRNIGAGAARTASALVAERQRSLSLADQVQRDFERMNTRGLSIMQQVQAERAYAASYAALGISQQRIKTGEEMLGNRILDANPYAQMEKELADIKKGINTLNNETLKPTSTR